MTYSCSCYLVIFGIDWVCMSRYCKTYRAFAQLVRAFAQLVRAFAQLVRAFAQLV